MAEQEQIALLARLPLYPEIREGGDSGVPITVSLPEHPASKAFGELAEKVVGLMPD